MKNRNIKNKKKIINTKNDIYLKYYMIRAGNNNPELKKQQDDLFEK